MAVVAAFSISPTYAQTARNRWFPEKQNFGANVERLNANTVTIVSGSLNGTYLSIAADLSAVLNEGDDFRLMPIMGKDGVQNIRDVRFLKGVDLGITQTNLLNTFRRNNELGPLDGRIVYITRLFSEEFHLVVRADSGVTSIEQLAGKKVNFGGAGTGTQWSTRDIFSRLNVKAEEVNLGQGDAIEKVKAGEIAGSAFIAAKPATAMARLKADEGLRFLPVSFAKPLHEDYLPGVLTSTDYPGAVPAGEEVETVAVGSVLIAYNWQKGSEPYRRLEDFVGRFFSKFSEFRQAGRHPKWQETNLAATVSGWARFQPAEDWLTRNREVVAARNQFNEFLSSRTGGAPIATQEERERLFLEFVKWTQGRERR
jgi:uncharacterized protein